MSKFENSMHDLYEVMLKIPQLLKLKNKCCDLYLKNKNDKIVKKRFYFASHQQTLRTLHKKLERQTDDERTLHKLALSNN